ncbi:MAG: cupin domain-containing protein [Ginsengibacter sp.]
MKSKDNFVWFLDSLVNIRVSERENPDGISLLEHRAYQNDSPPQHIHENEDEIFYVLEGEFRFLIDKEEFRLKKGDILTAPKGIPHTYKIESAEGGRWMTITSGKDFEQFVKAIGRPAGKIELPKKHGAPSNEEVEELTHKAAEYHIIIAGPPLH